MPTAIAEAQDLLMSTWESCELPVLRALATHFAAADARPATVPQIATASGLGTSQVDETLRVLAEAKPPYVVGSQMAHPELQPAVTGLTERAYHELEHEAYKREAGPASKGRGRPRRGGPPVRGPLPPGALTS